ncbi:DUF2975 domain-containing protein [Parvibaculaceae bacterium PLY_AMNH_Bact1]|nr:DUF2975 domain-containing protein [Parvibaculaceae bacterium PLY_AMNH_Bact1]
MHASERTERIKRTSRRFQRLTIALMGLLPLTAGLAWAFIDLNELDFGYTAEEVGPLTSFERWSAAALSIVPLSVSLFALYNLQKLFALYAKGKFFDSENVRCFRNMGWALVAVVPLDILFNSALSVLLSLDQPAGERMLAVSLSSDDLGIAIVGAVIIIVSWVMAEAADLSQENAQII